VGYTRSDWKSFQSIKEVFEKNGWCLGPDAPAICRWAMERVSPLAVSTGEIEEHNLRGPFSVLSIAPYAQLLALKGMSAPVAAKPAN
jgi:hypothetical protein